MNDELREIEKRFKNLEDKIDGERIDGALGKTANWIGSRIRPLGWLGNLSARLPWWVELLLIAAILFGVWFGWSAFVDWAGSRKYNAESAKLQADLKAAQDKAAKLEADYRTLANDYDALKLAAQQSGEAVKEQAAHVDAQAKRTQSASENYNKAVKNPVAVVTIDATSDKTLEASLTRLTEAVKTSMERAK